jgi:hypothetical protein
MDPETAVGVAVLESDAEWDGEEDEASLTRGTPGR